MTKNNRLIAIYDFEIFPYALGDVLTWNVRSAMRCIEEKREFVDIYICMDEHHPAGIYQRGLINKENYDLFFSELYSAFGTHPKLGNIYIYRNRESLLEQLSLVNHSDAVNRDAIHEYLEILKYSGNGTVFDKAFRFLERKIRIKSISKKLIQYVVPFSLKEAVNKVVSHESALNEYFIKYIHSHQAINQFAENRGSIPCLNAALGCQPDVDELILTRLSGKKIVTFHLRLRRLDAGYGGDHSYDRDSNYLEWYDFLRLASIKYPDITFVALGRLQEKPLQLLTLPNVLSLRVLGMGLGHELTLMLRSELFIGSSSGFAAYANFSKIPYFITKMNTGACHAYDIPNGAEKLPFATDKQKLIYEQESSHLLMTLLENGIDIQVNSTQSAAISLPHNQSSTTRRFYIDSRHRNDETIFLMKSYIEQAGVALDQGHEHDARIILQKIRDNFDEACMDNDDFQALWSSMSDKIGKTDDSLIVA